MFTQIKLNMKNFFFTSTRWMFLLVAIVSVEVSFAQLNPADKLPVDPKVKIGKLENGLTYYIRQNKKPEKKV